MDELINEMEIETKKYLRWQKETTGWETHYYAGQASAYTKVVVSLKALNEKMKTDNTIIVIDNCQN